jgi:hypothetical protein
VIVLAGLGRLPHGEIERVFLAGFGVDPGRLGQLVDALVG